MFEPTGSASRRSAPSRTRIRRSSSRWPFLLPPAFTRVAGVRGFRAGAERRQMRRCFRQHTLAEKLREGQLRVEGRGALADSPVKPRPPRRSAPTCSRAAVKPMRCISSYEPAPALPGFLVRWPSANRRLLEMAERGLEAAEIGRDGRVILVGGEEAIDSPKNAIIARPSSFVQLRPTRSSAWTRVRAFVNHCDACIAHEPLDTPSATSPCPPRTCCALTRCRFQ